MEGNYRGLSRAVGKAEHKMQTLDIQVPARHAEDAVPRCEPHAIQENLRVILPPLAVIARRHDARLREERGLDAEQCEVFDQCLKVPLWGSLEWKNQHF